MQRHYTVLLLMAMLCLWSCQQDKNPNPEVLQASFNMAAAIEKFPKLLDRPASIRMDKEWELVQSTYGQNRLKAVRGDHEAALKIAQLFTTEARITGEHGHYYPAALQILNIILEKHQEEDDLLFRVLTTKAGVLLSQHDFDHALEIGEKAMAINPYNAQIYGVLVDANVELGQYNKAVEMADKMVEIRPDLRSYSRISYLREIHGMTEAAIEAMEMAVEAGYPGFEETAWTLLELGNLYERYGKQDLAAKAFNAILASRPNYPFAIAALGRLEMANQAFDKAEMLLKQACDIIPEVGFYIDLANVYQQTGRSEKAALLKTEILAMLQDDVNSGHNMNLEYADLYTNVFPDLDKALDYAQKEYVLRPENIDVNSMLAKIYALKNDKEKATQHLKKATATGSKHPDITIIQRLIS